ncbi:MAG: hypothetical protein OXG65_03225 [Chloroflexi bacterium]|nr:hypothetical protein [Chloroflexota bacterium]
MRSEPSSMASLTAERDDPAAIPLDYVPLPAGPNGAVLIAHDRHRLRQVAGRALIAARTLRVDALPGDDSAVDRIEANAVRGLRRSGRHVRARLWAQVIAAVGLPFLVAALLGLLSVPIRNVPAVGAAVADFLGSAGGSLGGLPLAVAFSLLPSAWLIRRAHGRVASRPLARGAESALRVADLQVREDAGPFLAAADGLLADIGSLLSGRSRIDGQRALRLATRFDRLKQLAAHYNQVAVQAFAADMAAQFRRAGRPPRRLIPGLYARRNSVHIASVIAPYDPGSRSRTPTFVTVPAILLVGGLAAVMTFLAAGVFRLSADDALILLQNEAVVFPGSAGVFALGKGFDQPDDSGLGTLSVVQGPGLFWSWPQPVTDRRLINLTDRGAPVRLILPTEAEPEDLVVDFQYDVTDLPAYIRLGAPELADRFIAAVLEEGLTQLLASWRDSLVTEHQGNNATVNEELQSGMDDFLNQFVDIANANELLTGLGIILKPRPEFSIQRT